MQTTESEQYVCSVSFSLRQSGSKGGRWSCRWIGSGGIGGCGFGWKGMVFWRISLRLEWIGELTVRLEKNMAFGNTGFSRCKMPLICIFSNIRLNNSKYVINTFFNCYRKFKSVIITRIFPISVYIWDFISSSLSNSPSDLFQL